MVQPPKASITLVACTDAEIVANSAMQFDLIACLLVDGVTPILNL